MEIPFWFYDDDDEDTIDELSKLDVNDDFSFLASSERTQCQFVNTIGIRCPERYWGESPCCVDHRCTYISDKKKQCTNTIDCHSRWYCTKHGTMCKCQYRVKKKQCPNMVYFYMHKFGCAYCLEHQCTYNGCKNPIGDNIQRLCVYHFQTLIFCKHIKSDGNQCTNVIDRAGIDFDKVEKSESDGDCCEINTKDDRLSYCPEHICRVEFCHRHIRNDATPWCAVHSVQCEYIFPENSQQENTPLSKDTVENPEHKNVNRCKNYACSINLDSDTECKYPILCNIHRCHWEGRSSDWKSICHKHSVVKDDCSLYCEEHYNIYRFHKFEYTS